MVSSCEFGGIGTSRGLDLEDPNDRFASSNHKARRKSSETVSTDALGAVVTGAHRAHGIPADRN